MKKLIPLVALVLLLASLPMVAVAESETSAPTVPTDQYIEEESTDSINTTSVTAKVNTGSYTEIYSCPVRKSSVDIKFTRTTGPTTVKLMVEIDTGSSWEALTTTKSVNVGHTVTFDLGGNYKYRVYALATAGISGTCDFELEGNT